MSSAQRPRSGRRPGWYIPWLFVGGFAIIIAANATMVGFALTSWSGLETQSSFDAGNAYNRTLAAVRAQEARGWQADAAFVPITGLAGTARMTLRDAEGAGLDGARAKLHLERPGRDGLDQEVPLTAIGGGVYEAALTLPIAGRWRVRIVARYQDQDYQTLQEWLIE